MKAELRELVRLSGVNLKEEARLAWQRELPAFQRSRFAEPPHFSTLQVFDVLVDLTQLDVVPTAISQVTIACTERR